LVLHRRGEVVAGGGRAEQALVELRLLGGHLAGAEVAVRGLPGLRLRGGGLRCLGALLLLRGASAAGRRLPLAYRGRDDAAGPEGEQGAGAGQRERGAPE